MEYAKVDQEAIQFGEFEAGKNLNRGPFRDMWCYDHRKDKTCGATTTEKKTGRSGHKSNQERNL